MAEVIERIPIESWQTFPGHLERYAYAGQQVWAGERVNDVACGIGYGVTYLLHAVYHGYDRAGVFGPFPGDFHVCDLDDPGWEPAEADCSICFETLEHVRDPARLAAVLCETTRRAIVVSVPVIPTRHFNPHHRHDFTKADIPRLFQGFRIVDEWSQPSDRSHIWTFRRGVATPSLLP